ncbi:type II CRISPR RNA-guided endonuclease Cas9 [Polynucleobacter arcticus]|uniref:CRISPR-associated endonuclease Cas9 n=1 Tax=Polynucleobacter arcticus TaxID=1743165 RepID=A0A6M9PJC7_9BURK|nr:type II CRISPR RNA-guided endonuclease Cas9 [Polynucleobacter arcticus]QKM60062.1 type II CRISPR RNA-guided endonuclease Cas9 [Polynucleobacter arcticus]
MLPKLRYRLALDLGTSSIGWCLLKINPDYQPQAIIKMGVRIFSDGRNPKDGSSLAVTRREARQMRRRRDRLLKRKARLIDSLIKHGFFPKSPEERHASVTLDPYLLRRKGLYETLSASEFARALFHLNQRRGFLSNRKTDKKDNDSGALKQAIIKLRKKLEEEQCQTLGEWLAKRHEQGLSVRARLRGKTQKDKAYDFYADRAMIEHEFDTLWEKQRVFNAMLFNEAARLELKDVLLFQRNLKPVRPGRCTLIPEEERAPLALPSTQLFRIYQEVNNLRILSEQLAEAELSKGQRDQIVSLLNLKSRVTFKGISKALKLSSGSSFNLEDVKREFLKGNSTTAILSKDDLFGDSWHELNLLEQDTIVSRLLNDPSEQKVIAWLMNKFTLDESTAERIANASLPEGYGSLSKAALDKILPQLMGEVVTYDKAVVAAGFDSHSALSHSQSTGEIMESLPYYGDPLRRHVAFAKDNPRNNEERFGKIANPTVHIGLNELRKVVNALIKRYGHPSEVIVEVTRDLKLSREKKKEIERDQKDRQDFNEKLVIEACGVLNLNPDNLDRSKRRELSQKMQLWYELNPHDVTNRCCPYTGEQLNISKLLSSEVEIEHILPYSRTLDDSLNNKTVCISRANRIKGNDTPYEAFGAKTEPGYDYESIVHRASLMSKNKGKRFTEDGYQRWLKEDKDFLARALNDTAYLSKIAKEYLSLICPPNRVRAIPGRMTALLRGTFGLNQLLSSDSSKNRDDHRHHALDAAVIGVTDQGLLQRFSQASANARSMQLDRLVENMPLPWDTYREHVERGLSNIVVSHKPDHGYRGAMHEETAWGLRSDGVATRRIHEEGSDHRIREFANKKLVEISSTKNPDRHGLDSNGEPAPYKGYVGGSNYCLEICRDETGKWHGDVISTYEAYQVIRKLGEAEGAKKLSHSTLSQTDKPLVMRLMMNDYLRIKIDGISKIMRVVKIAGNGQISLALHREANVDARNRDKLNTFSYISKMAGSLKTAEGYKITVSPIGEVSSQFR